MLESLGGSGLIARRTQGGGGNGSGDGGIELLTAWIGVAHGVQRMACSGTSQTLPGGSLLHKHARKLNLSAAAFANIKHAAGKCRAKEQFCDGLAA